VTDLARNGTTRPPSMAPGSNPDPARRQAAHQDGPGVHRLAAFSDGVFAIAATLLVFQLNVPSSGAAHAAAPLAEALWRERASFISYAFTFAVIAAFWLGHHRAFRHISHHDQALACLNIAYLGTIAFLPFASALLGRYQANRLAAAIYGSTLAASLLLAAALWRHACRAGLVTPGVPARFRRWILVRALASAAIFTASAATAVITVAGAEALWALSPAVTLIISHIYRDVRRLLLATPGIPQDGT
jgi:uncharacterized membrane protein